MAREALEAADGHSYGGSMTAAVMAICLMAASCGLVFGYHVGVAGK
jgi:predicted alpha/beta-hydrolase family hydrolase